MEEGFLTAEESLFIPIKDLMNSMGIRVCLLRLPRCEAIFFAVFSAVDVTDAALHCSVCRSH